jgi:hypothetical protein
MTTNAVGRSCSEAAVLHDEAAAHHRRSAKHLSRGEHVAAADERTLALAHSKMAREAEALLGWAAAARDDRPAMEAAWRFMD